MHNSLSPQRRTALYECLNYLNSMPSNEFDSKVSFPRRMKIPNISSQLGLDPLINTYRHSLSFVKLGRLCARSRASTACASRQYLREPHPAFGSQSLHHHFHHLEGGTELLREFRLCSRSVTAQIVLDIHQKAHTLSLCYMQEKTASDGESQV